MPYVFLPQHEQIIHPYAEIRFEGVTTPVCIIAGAQQLGRTGWFELRNLSNAEPPFRLFRDEGRTFLKWLGEARLRDAAEGRVVTAKLVCRDTSPKSKHPGVFTPCVAFRVAGSPSKSTVREVMFSSTSQVSQGLSATEYIAIGLSSVILALIYVASVSLYLHSRNTKRKSIEEPEVTLSGSRDGGGLVKNNPLLAASRHFESDTNSGLTESDVGDELPQSDGEQIFENITSAIIHPHCIYLEQSEGIFGSGTILGERLPEEDVRVVETVDSSHQHDAPVLLGTQRRKLYFNPAYFDRQLLLAPPPAAIEFLLKIREVISIAKHKMATKRFVPTLVGIPEEESGSERCESPNKRPPTTNSAQSSNAKSRKSQRCTGCPGCRDALQNLPTLPEADLQNPGESKVRAWLEDVRQPQHRWRDIDDTRKNFQENVRTFTKSLEYLKELAKGELYDDVPNLASKALSSWKDNPPMLRTFQHIARSEILENEDRHSVSKRSTKSMFAESNFNRYMRQEHKNSAGDFGNNAINEKVRKAIENSFIKQMEENIAMEKESTESKENEEPTANTSTITKEPQRTDKYKNSSGKKAKKQKKELPDMINELPGSKNTAKRIMDAVIREMVDVKALEHHSKSQSNNNDYEVDSLERSKCSRKPSLSPESTNQSSPTLSTALPMDEELTMQNAVINTRTGEMTIPKIKKEVLEHNYYNSLPELISQRPESYSLVSEVYVNDGYDSPACSDDSGPEIQYEPENPGHLTIKVQDSPENYVKQDESEYEPDTLDRKPMKLKINDDVNYDKEIANEVYVDSLERPAQILLRSKGSFRDDESRNNNVLQRGYGSLREIYEARLRSNLKDSNLMGSTKSLNSESDGSLSWRKCKYLTPNSKQAKRQRQPHNQPDVVPLPPAEDIYQQPKPPRRVEEEKLSSKNGWDRSPVEAGDPTTSDGAPVPINQGCNVGNDTRCSCKTQVRANEAVRRCYGDNLPLRSERELRGKPKTRQSTSADNSEQVLKPTLNFFKEFRKWEPGCREGRRLLERNRIRSASDRLGEMIREKRMCSEKVQNCSKGYHQSEKSGDKGCSPSGSGVLNEARRQIKIEDSGYLSSTDSNGSHKRLLKHEVGSVSETDETESICDGASESGAESVGTDSVFFGNFRSLSEVSDFSKSVDSGVDIGIRNFCFRPFEGRNEIAAFERTNLSTSDSETESFVTVLPPCGSQRNSIVS